MFNPAYTYSNQTKVIEVNGMNGALSYPLAPNSSVLLLDSNSQKVYLKISDGGGYATTREFELVEVKPVDKSQSAIEMLESRINVIEERLNEQFIDKRTRPNEPIKNKPKGN